MEWKIIKKTFNGEGNKKYIWFIYVEIRYLLWNIFGEGDIFMEDCKFKNFRVKKNSIFFLEKYICELISNHNNKSGTK